MRFWAAMGTYLNPDEALHFGLVNQNTVAEAYRNSLTNAHPPLLFVVLYFWRFVGDSEIMLRLPSVLANTTAVWMLFQWVRLVLGNSAGFIALFLGAFSPPLIGLAAEIRQYSILLASLTSALYFLERAFRDKSTRAMWLFSVFLYLGILTHYSALWFTAALGIYALIRIRELPLNIAASWVASQCGAAVIYVLLYFTHISKIKGSPMAADAFAGWLREVYYHPESQGLFEFVRGSTASFFGYVLSLRAGGLIVALVFFAGVLWIMIRGDHRDRRVPWQFGVLLILPFVLNCLAGILGVFPYGGTRHCVYLSLFAIAGISSLVARAALDKLWSVWIAAVVLVPMWLFVAVAPPQQIVPSLQKAELMRDAIAYLRSSAPPNGYVFTDGQAGSLLDYYLGRDQVGATAIECGEFRQIQYGSYRLISYHNWQLPADMLAQRVSEWRSMCNVPAESVWVFDGGWDENILPSLRNVTPVWYSRERQFGDKLSVFEFSRPPVIP